LNGTRLMAPENLCSDASEMIIARSLDFDEAWKTVARTRQP